ncbi:MAG: TPM domain-containing protein [Paraprevotella sp.]|nr:TPM domain-containing protein [Paraprevotella sp.]
MEYLQEKTRHVCKPAGIISPETVQQMDSMLYRLEHDKGVQSVVAVVENIEGGDCYDFALTLGNKLGVGNRQNTGLIILLSTQDRCYQILTGEGLEGTLPDAICRRIENRKMIPYLKTGDWNNAMLQTVATVCGVIRGDDSLLNAGNGNNDRNDSDYSFVWIILALIVTGGFISWRSNRKRNTCPKCGAYPMQRVDSRIQIDRIQGVEHHQEMYRCPKCGHTECRSHDEPFDNGAGFGEFPPIIGPFRGFGGGSGGGFSGGSFGGGSFGGGGSGGRF